MEHFAFPGNIDFAANDQGFDVFIHRLWNKVYYRWITNNFPCKWNTSTAGAKPRPGRFSTETPLERELRLQIQREQRRRRRQQETAEQKEHRLAQRRQRRQQETEEQEIGIRGIMIVLQSGKPRFLSLPVSPPIYRSASAKLQFSITAQSIIIFRRTALPYFFVVFAFFQIRTPK